MTETNNDRLKIYEIGFLLASSVPEDGVVTETEAIKKIIAEKGASILTEETPHLEQLAYTMKKKTVSGSYDTHSQGYFGWIKFEVDSSQIEPIKNSIEKMSSILRLLVIETVRENTYLGKRASQIAASITAKEEGNIASEGDKKPEDGAKPKPIAVMEDVDKSIDEMVKEV